MKTVQAQTLMPQADLIILVGSQVSTASDAPFLVDHSNGQIQIVVPHYAKIFIKEEWHWNKIHDGSRWAQSGLVDYPKKLEFHFANAKIIRIALQGKTWTVKQRPRQETPVPFKVSDTLKQSKHLGLSLFAHLNIGLALWLLSTWVWTGSTSENAAEKAAKAIEQAPASAGGGEVSPVIPFAGMTYTAYLRQLERAKQEADPLGYLAKSLKGMKSSGSVGTGNISGAASALGGIGNGKSAGGTNVSSQVAQAKFDVPSSGAANSKATEKQKLALREKYRDLQEDMRRIYSRLLGEDPTLSVTAAIQIRVQPSGYFEMTEFKARGTYQTATLQKLRSEISDLVKSVFVGPEFNGMNFRAEQVFVR